MKHTLREAASGLSDRELVRQVALLAGRERQATVELVAHLAELDARKLYAAEGYGSLFTYCTRALGLAEHAAYNRIEAARLVRTFPAILDRLADGSLNLSTLRLLGPHLRADNLETLVAQARERSKREVEELVARLAPRPDVEASVRKLPARPSRERRDDAPERVPTVALAAGTGESAVTVDVAPTPLISRRPVPRPVVEALAPERYRVQFTVGAATHEKLRRVQDLLRREIPDGDPGEIFDRALTRLLEDVARKKLAETSRPRQVAPTRQGSRHIPARVRRAVWVRDGGQCAFVARSGCRCRERAFLEFHHREPYAIGGEPTLVNIALRCRAHNVYESELLFGPRQRELAPGRVAKTDPTGADRETAMPR
jgi:hypothetical protein